MKTSEKGDTTMGEKFKKLKGKIAIVTALCLTLTLAMPIGASAVTVSDISDHWAKETIQDWVDQEYINGYEDSTFKPDNNITRAEFMTLANKAFGYTATTAITYTDVAADAWYADEVAKAKAAGYIEGYPDGTMKPEGAISREEVASIIVKIDALNADAEAANVFTDAAKLLWSKGAVGATKTAKIMIGYPDGSFGPQTMIKRGEAVVTLDRAMNYKNGPVTPVTPEAPPVTRNDSEDTVAGMTTAMEYKLDDGSWKAYVASEFNALDLSGDHTLLVRFAATESSPVSLSKTLNFTATSGGGGGTVANAVDLGMAGSYAILAKSGISSVPNSVVTGNIGVSPVAATFITGFSLTMDATNVFATSTQVTGKVYASDYTLPTPSNLTTAVSNMEAAYTDAAGRAADYTELYSGDLSGKTLTAGVYKWGTEVMINTDVTLSGDANDVFIFQIAKGITQANGAKIILAGGVQAKNIFWQSAETVSIGTNAHFEGIILGMKNITLGTNSTMNGRLLAQTAVTLDQSTVVAPQ